MFKIEVPADPESLNLDYTNVEALGKQMLADDNKVVAELLAMMSLLEGLKALGSNSLSKAASNGFIAGFSLCYSLCHEQWLKSQCSELEAMIGGDK